MISFAHSVPPATLLAFLLSAVTSWFKCFVCQTCEPNDILHNFGANKLFRSKQITLNQFRINTYEKPGGRGVVIVNLDEALAS